MYNKEIVQQDLQRELRAHPSQAMARKAAQPPVFFDIGKDDFDGLPSQAVDRLGLRRFHPGPVRNNEVFVLATLDTPSAFFARGTELTQGASLTGLGLAAISPFHHLAPATTLTGVTPTALEQLAGWAGISIEVTVPGKAILAKKLGGLGPAPVIFFPRTGERHALRGALGSVHCRDIATIDQEFLESASGHLVATPQHWW